MTTSIVIIIGIILSVGFHFIGVYVNARKIIWTMIIFMWVGTINVAMSEIKPAGYEDIKKMKGQFADTDKIIEEAGEEISVYEMIGIKKSYITNNPKK